jgi:hypothetical protein
MKRISVKKLKALEKLEKDATQAPWEFMGVPPASFGDHGWRGITYDWRNDIMLAARKGARIRREENMEFIKELRNNPKALIQNALMMHHSVTPCEEAHAVSVGVGYWQDRAGRLEQALEKMRDTFLHDPEHDSDTVNWALSIVDDALRDQLNDSAEETSETCDKEVRS